MRAQVFCCGETSAHTTHHTPQNELRRRSGETTQCKKLANGALHDAAHRFHQGVLYFLHTVQSNSTNLN